jgi:hypothetical protein
MHPYQSSFRYLVLLGGLAGVLSMAPERAGAQTPVNAKANTNTAGKTWKLPRTIDGQPDFQGVWSNNNATPLQRPKDLAGRTTLTDEEVNALKTKAKEFFDTGGDAEFGDTVFEAVWASVKANASGPHKKAEKGFDGDTGDYNTVWIAARDWDNRTSLITDPPDGRMPPMTDEAQKRVAAATTGRKPVPEGPEDRGLSERCITYGSPRLLAGYDSYYQIVQSKNSVAIGMEQIHDIRVIPLDGNPHPPATVQTWMGDSRGHWDGDTLVVDTTNYKPNAFMNATAGLHTIERFTRTGEGVLEYKITIDDPATWTKPWTLMIPLRHTDEMMYEYACHEGNIAMTGMLKGARLQEAEAGAKK